MITSNGATPVQSLDAVSVIVGPFTEGEQTNPTDELLMADSKALPAGAYEVLASVGASAASDLAVEQRNQANDGNVVRVVIKAVAGQTGQYRFFIQAAEGQRVRILMDDAQAAGTVAAWINLRLLP